VSPRHARVAGPGPRGWAGHGQGGAHLIEPAPELRATTVQACGLWPFPVGSGAPLIGVPLGHHLVTGETVACDPISWFDPAALIPNPSAMIVAMPGIGKSSVTKRMELGLAAMGINPFVVGDLKGEHVALVLALGGSCVKLGRGEGSLNVLDPGSGMAAARRLSGKARDKLLADVFGRRLNVLGGLIALNRRTPVADVEELILSLALRLLDDRFEPGEATLHDLVALIELGPDELRAITLERGEDKRYRDVVDDLQRSLLALVDGALGDSFAQRTSVCLDLSRPLVVDISGIGESDDRLVAATLLATWAEGFGAIAAAQALASAGLEPQRNWLVVMDELWRVLRSGASGMIARIDALTRLDRHLGTGTLLITHSVADLMAFPEPADALRAKGFVERVGLKIIGGVPPGEVDDLQNVIGFTEREAAIVGCPQRTRRRPARAGQVLGQGRRTAGDPGADEAHRGGVGLEQHQSALATTRAAKPAPPSPRRTAMRPP
jgi:hypothetical protein